jgi:stage V sporulation protein B
MLLGLQSGVVEPLVNIPVIISVSISASILPNVSRLVAKHNSRSSVELKGLIEKAYQICLSISVACFICFIIFGRQALDFLYGNSFDKSELLVGTRLLFFGAINIVFLSLVQVTTGIMQGIGEHKYAVKSLMFGSGIKLVSETVLLLIKSINIYGVVISGGLCYVVVLLLNYKKIKHVSGASLKESVLFVSVQSAVICLVAYLSNMLFVFVFNETISMFIAGMITVAVFAASYYVLFVMRDKDDGKAIWKGKLT